ncbi:hypothetical protein SUDANB32_01028 [Streptomyces sp. enrichment culture]|uniref:hypothetical protein n=1 Tax=Streptomyces sp. enrichment culture TaxID=1795815 RepID=UPI003F546701
MTSQSTAIVRSRLVEQAASDLEENRRQQRELTERMAVLQQEEALLTDILDLARRYEGIADRSPLPEQLRDESVTAKTKRTTGGTASRRSGGTAAPVGGRTKTGAKGKTQRPLLGDLLLELLGRHDAPCAAADLRDELLEAHPDRNPTPQVVRNTLESLVAKGRIRRHKEQRSVMYTVVPEAKS